MIKFDCDYMCGAHPEVMEALVATNNLLTPGYGVDEYCTEAKKLIREACSAPDAEVYFFVGGTPTNATAIDGILAPYQGVIATELAHINVHEAGAIEACGHKILTIESICGKVDAAVLDRYMHDFVSDDTNEHMVEPGMVYISFATEIGTVYTLSELEDIRHICDKYKLRLYLDGARLGYGLASPGCDVALSDIARLCDVFYIGGTKQGALFGEALVAKPGVLRRFVSTMKLHGAVLAKGRLLGVQFKALFSNDLYMRISRHAVGLALKLRDAFESCGYAPVYDSPTNQQFFELPNSLIDKLSENISFELWGPRGRQCSKVRFVTGWETTCCDVEALEKTLHSEAPA